MPYPKIKCGCLGCGRTFKPEKDGGRALERAVKHMTTCCPDKLDSSKRQGNLLQRCWIGCKNCEVPGYVHETSKQRKRRESANAGEAERHVMELLSMRDDLLKKFGMKSAAEDFCEDFYDFGAIAGSYDDSDEDAYDHTPVDFLRPDGEIEGKDIQWCLDNNFFQIEDGFWSGPWYYNDRPEQESMHQKRLRETESIQRMNEKRRSRATPKWKQEEAAEKEMEETFCAMLQNDIDRTLYGRGNHTPREPEHVHSAYRRSQQHRTHTPIDSFGSQFSSLILNPNATEFKPVGTSSPDADNKGKTETLKTEDQRHICCASCKNELLNRYFVCPRCKVTPYCDFEYQLEHLREHKSLSRVYHRFAT